MNKLEANTLLQGVKSVSFNVLNEFINAVIEGNFDVVEGVDFDSLSDEDLWMYIDSKYKYAAIEHETDDKYQLWYFTSKPVEFCEVWDTDDDCFHDRFRLYTTTKPYVESLRVRPE